MHSSRKRRQVEASGEVGVRQEIRQVCGSCLGGFKPLLLSIMV